MKLSCRELAMFSLLVTSAAPAQASDTRSQIEESIARADYAQANSLLNAYLEKNPTDNAMRLQKAQVLRWQGNLDAAMAEYDALCEQYPDNVDYLFGRAQTLLLRGQQDLALADIRTASALAPDYEDVWRLYYRLLSLQPDTTASIEARQLRDHASAHFADATWWIAQPVTEPISWTLRSGGAVQHLSNGAPGWSSLFAEVSYSTVGEDRYQAGVSREERFDNADIQFSLAADWQLPGDWVVGTGVAGSADPNFLPSTEITLHAERPIGKGWVVNANFRRRSYQNDRVDTYGGVVEYYFDSFRAAWFIGLSDLNGSADSISQALSLNWYVNDSTSFGGSVNFGNEAEVIAPGQILKSRVSGIAITGRHSLSARVSLDWWLGMQEQGDFYRRQYAGMAVSVGI